ncbi:hypothetical protein [Yoonia sp.]|uniref:hypothetical protein n=1 Tax=Yoonia sp. TaxID=2212373 RepID=UPI002E0215CE|nr:hypothetical protein [Yoonia sp.]
MALRYDFDMVEVPPTGVAGEKVAMFRDPATVAALKEADAAVQAYFSDSGFILQEYNSGAPPGRYPMRDEEARIALIDRLTANLDAYDLANVNWGGFDFDAFMNALSTAEPVEDALLAPLPGVRSDDLTNEIIAARIASRQKKGRRMLALGGLLLGLILLFYVASQTLM